jgi:uncharacterized SAM-binding protein YcdF (DUF218 family)
MARSRRSRLTIAGVVAVVALAAVGTATWRFTSAPSAVSVGEVPSSDAIVVFVGGKGERLEVVHQLLDAGVAPNVVIPNGLGPGWYEGNQLCLEETRAEVFCPALPDGDTRSEARLIGRIATENSWQRLVVVTSDYHLERARLRLSRCFDGEVEAVAADSDLGGGERMGKLIHELFGHVEARVVERGC